MQRLHHDDVAGRLALAGGWQHLMIPMGFDLSRRSITYRRVTKTNGHTEVADEEFWRDPRTVNGELIDPDRLPPDIVDQMRRGKDAISWAAQYQQAPIAHAMAMAGAYFKRAWFKLLDIPPADVAARVRRWDLASTEGGGDWTVGVKLARLKSGGFVVEDVVRAQHSPRRVRDLIVQCAKLDGHQCAIVIPQDPGQAGVQQVEEYANLLAGYTIRTPRETGDKVTRSGPASAQSEAGNVSLVRAAWNEPFLQSLEAFPDEGVHDDDVDAFAGAMSFLAIGDQDRQQRYMAAMKKFSEGRV
jgi:predicted phage terminase large subunit-like protein